MDGELALYCLEFEDELPLTASTTPLLLAMDLKVLGRKDLGDYFLVGVVRSRGYCPWRCCAISYIVYRAVVRESRVRAWFSQGKPRPLRTPCAT